MKPTPTQVRLVSILIMAFITSPMIANAFPGDQKEQTIKITAKKFEYTPNEIRLKKGVPIVLELTSLDRVHGFNCPDLGVRTTIEPGKVSQVHIVAQKAGTYEFHCDIFCGDGHEDMSGKIIVEE
ncbi:MAG TPA: cupredoxin domain-containing protein [Thermodesulfovibrionales bacterium]|nr:cupredoxin domain-containing protein [Thermodesulfovibrionales bacterium]